MPHNATHKVPLALRVLMVAAEMAPWAKVGGLGDVIGALPLALQEAGAAVTVAVPGYPHFEGQLARRQRLHPEPFYLMWQSAQHAMWISLAEGPGDLPVLLVDCPSLFDRPGIYRDPKQTEAYPDNLVRWIALCRGALLGASLLGGVWDIVHAHDYHAALTLPLLRREHASSALGTAASLISIHNLAHQGVVPLSTLDAIGFSAHDAQPLGPFEFFGKANLLKAGLVFADGLHTVSPTYAQEIVSDDVLGCGLRGVLWERREQLHGILNGIDTTVWDPSSDAYLACHYDASDLSGKAQCKAALQQACGWIPNPARFLIGVVSRLSHQKGLDLLVEALPALIEADCQVVLLGQGDVALEAALRDAMAQWPAQVHVWIDFDEARSHQIQAGADAFLMPSRFEPCGLAQMYAMQYGTLPIVRRTGGLADTVAQVAPAIKTGTGFLFDDADVVALTETVLAAQHHWAQGTHWKAWVQQAMAQDFSWARAAQEYLAVYQRLRANRTLQIPSIY